MPYVESWGIQARQPQVAGGVKRRQRHPLTVVGDPRALRLLDDGIEIAEVLSRIDAANVRRGYQLGGHKSVPRRSRGKPGQDRTAADRGVAPGNRLTHCSLHRQLVQSALPTGGRHNPAIHYAQYRDGAPANDRAVLRSKTRQGPTYLVNNEQNSKRENEQFRLEIKRPLPTDE